MQDGEILEQKVASKFMLFYLLADLKLHVSEQEQIFLKLTYVWVYLGPETTQGVI